MLSVKAPDTKNLSYSQKTIERAERSLRVSPFRLKLLTIMRSRSVDFQEIVGASGYNSQFTRRPLSELATESSLQWLIQVGVLRREVDGQGITNSFRLTPLGHQIIEQINIKSSEIPTPTLRDRFYNALSRWLRLPL